MPQLLYSPSHKTNSKSFTGVEFISGEVCFLSVNESSSHILMKIVFCLKGYLVEYKDILRFHT